MANIIFGTDGWRAIVGEDFNSENVETVTNAIGKYVFERSSRLPSAPLISFTPKHSR